MPRLLVCLLSAGMLLQALGVQAEPWRLGPDIPYSIITETDRPLTPEEALVRLQPLPPNQHWSLTRGYISSTFWLRFEIPALVFNQEVRWLELGPAFIDDIQLFYRPLEGRHSWQVKHTGDRHSSASDIDYRNPIMILQPPIATSEGYEVLLRIQSSSTVLLQATLWEPEELFKNEVRATAYWSFYFGLAALSSLLALILALILGGRMLWSVATFPVSYLLVASVQGFIHWNIPFIGSVLQHYLTSVLTLVTYALLIWVCSETLNFRKLLPRAYKALASCSWLIAALVVLIPLDQYGTAIKIKTAIYLCATTIFISSTVLIWCRDRFRVTTLLLSAVPLTCILGSLSSLFTVFGLIPFRAEIYAIWQYTLIINMLLVMAIAVYRIREKSLIERDKLQLAHELKTERDASFHQRQFIGIVAHEFRTPLAVISASLDNLNYCEPSDPKLRAVRYSKIQRSTERLIQLADNCLADARLSADQLYLDQRPHNLFELVSSAAALVQLADSHQLQITWGGEPANPGLCDGSLFSVDAALLRIALSSVIDNAVKYSTGGCIRIDCEVSGHQAAISISDQGCGIEPHETEQIFERYRRGSSSQQGSGLGLYTARQIARAHGGDLRLADNSRHGCCFVFTLIQPKDLHKNNELG